MKLTTGFLSALLMLQVLVQPLAGQEDPQYYIRLEALAKTWGFAKYFHPGLADCEINWDSVLIAMIIDAGEVTSLEEFNQGLLAMLAIPGPIPQPSVPPVEVVDSLKRNLDLSWIESGMFNAEVKTELENIRDLFRPNENCYITAAPFLGLITSDDDQYYDGPLYPAEPMRLLALFRYWNIINYYYPYKTLTDHPWAQVLSQFIPRMVKAKDRLEYHLAIKELATYINDSHAYTSSPLLDSIFSNRFYPPFSISYIEDSTVITHVADSISSIRNGDVILEINGVPVQTIRDSLARFIMGSNAPRIQRNINFPLIQGDSGAVSFKLANEGGERVVATARSVHAEDYSEIRFPGMVIWKDTLVDNSCLFRYVDMNRLKLEHIEQLFADAQQTDAIIFDLRNYPDFLLYELGNYLLPQAKPFSRFTQADMEYPGVLKWSSDLLVGSECNEDYYRGNVIILFNEETISRAEFTVMSLEVHPNTIKIGSQTAGADGNIANIKLPGQVQTWITGIGVYYPDGTPAQRIGIIPDIEVRPTIAGIRSGRDEVLEAALDCSILFDQSVNIDCATSTGAIAADNLMQLFPNPAFESINITIPGDDDFKGEFLVTGIDGKRHIGEPVSGNEFSVALNDLPAGIYFIEIRGSRTKVCLKVHQNWGFLIIEKLFNDKKLHK